MSATMSSFTHMFRSVCNFFPGVTKGSEPHLSVRVEREVSE